MGLFNVFKLANDYAKLRKFLDNNKTKVNEIKELVDKCMEHLRYLKDLKEQLDDIIKEFKEDIDKVKSMLKGDK